MEQRDPITLELARLGRVGTPWIEGVFPEKPGGGFKPIEHPFGHEGWYQRHCGRGELTVCCSAKEEDDGQLWIHVSASHNFGLPSHGDMEKVKQLFIGPARTAVQVYPPKGEYINLAPVLHLFALADENERPLPDFRVLEGKAL